MDDLKGTSWVVLRQAGTKSHFCHRDMVADLTVDLMSRFKEEVEVRGAVQGVIELPGMCMSDRPWEDIVVEDFKLQIPSQDFGYYRAILEKSSLRKFANGKEYYKIHGWMTCVVLSPKQREEVMKQMDEVAEEVDHRAEEADEEFSRRLSEVNKRSPVKIVSQRDKNLVKSVGKKSEDLN